MVQHETSHIEPEVVEVLQIQNQRIPMVKLVE